ncbi:MAG: glycosyltransferase family 4 protein [Candidatus Thermoplasmatota archaeon]
MRVLIVNPKMYFYGGAELVIVKLANYLTKKSIDNAILTTSMVPEIRRDIEGSDIILPEKMPKKGFLYKSLSRIINLELINETLILHKYVHKNLKSFDLINVHNFPAELSVFQCNKPTVWMCNEPPIVCIDPEIAPFPFNKTYKMLLNFDRSVVRKYIKKTCVADKFNAERFEKLYGIKPEIIYYGIEHEFFSKGDKENAIKKFDLQNNFTIIQVGVLSPLKNQMESIKTIEKLREKIQNIKLILAGYGYEDYKAMLQEYINKKGLNKYVIFTNHISREELRDLYKACDVALFPIKSQGGWLSPFEALCACKPIIVSKLITSANIIKNEGIGIITDNFVDAVMDVYAKPTKYNDMAKRGERWVKDNLSWDRFCEKMLRVFEDIISFPT